MFAVRFTKVLILIDHMGMGGTQTVVLNLAEGIIAQGYTLKICGLSGADDPQTVHKLQMLGVEYQAIGKKKILLGYGILNLYLLFHNYSPNILITFLPYADHFGRVIGKITGVKKIISAERTDYLKKPRLCLFLDRITYRFASIITFNSQQSLAQAKLLDLLNTVRGVYIPNGIKLGFPSKSKVELLKDYGLEGFIVGTVSRLSPEKNIQLILHGFALSKKTTYNTTLIIVGDGPQKKELVELAVALKIDSYVRFLGKIDAVQDILAMLDVFISTSQFEGMPNALMEAMAAGLPVLATPVGAVPDLIKSNNNGLLLPVNPSPEELEQAILRIFNEPAFAKDLGNNAKHTILSQYSMDSFFSSYMEMLEL